MRFAFGYPNDGWITTHFDNSKTSMLIREFQKDKKDRLLGCYGIQEISCSIPLNRNAIVERFLTSTTIEEYLMMIDTDISFDNDILDQFNTLINDHNKYFENPPSIIAGRVNVQMGMPVFYTRVERGKYINYCKPFHGLRKFDRVGTGIILLRRELLKAMKETLKGPHWFDHEIEGGRMATDDFSFCAKVERHFPGMDIFGAWAVKGEHWKMLPLGSNYREEFDDESEPVKQDT